MDKLFPSVDSYFSVIHSIFWSNLIGWFFFLKHGAIKLVKINDDGEEISIDILQKGDIFGELNLEKSGGGEEYFKVVTEEAIICTFFREKLEDVMLQKPDFALNYIKIIGFNFKKILF